MKIKDLEKLSPAQYYYDVGSQMRDFIYNLANKSFEVGEMKRDQICTIEEFEKYKDDMRMQLIGALGGLPSNEIPLNAKIVGQIQCEGYRIEKVIFEARPQVFITANLYIPDGITTPRGAVLFVCGHHKEAKHVEEYQIVCQHMVRAGLVVLSQDPVGQGERFSYYEKELQETTIDCGTTEHDYAGCQCWPVGSSLAGYFLHDAMRGVDYLCSRPEVDSEKIGVTGNSGGGTQSCLLMLCDPRIAAAAPATFLMDRKSYMLTGGAQDSEQIWPGFTASGFDHENVLMAMAPKPVLVLAVKYDFFPIEGTRNTVTRGRRYWEFYGKGNALEYFEDDSVHKYTISMAQKAAEFFALHLLGQRVCCRYDRVSPLPPSQLWCTQSGQVRGEMRGAHFVFEENLVRLQELETSASCVDEEQRKASALDWLQTRIFSNRKETDLNPRHYTRTLIYGLEAQSAFWWSQKGLMNHAVLFRSCTLTNETLPVVVALWDEGTNRLQSHMRWILETCRLGKAVMVLDVTGVGAISPNPFNNSEPLDFYGVIFKLAHELIWLNDSLPAMRTYDVIRALDMIEIWQGLDSEHISIYCCNRTGLYGQLAAGVDKRIREIEIVDGMESFKNWVGQRYYDSYDIMSVSLPNVLKYFDLPEFNQWIEKKIINHSETR